MPPAPPKPAKPMPPAPPPHRWHDDLQGLLTGTLLVALSTVMYRQTQMVTGGTFGLAFLLNYATGWRLGVVFFVLNLPFYWLAWRRMGKAFALKTLLAVTLLSLWTELFARWVVFAHLEPLLGALLAGVLTGTGMLMLFRHRASLGGLNVLMVYLQQTRGWSAGLMQMALDVLIVALALLVVPWRSVLLSVLAALALNAVLAINHRPGRYMAA